jgi:glycosyltransferase involved in cell wall biosynthesis
MIGPGSRTKGGIAKVILYYQSTAFWKDEDVKWIETYCTGSSKEKIWTFFSALISFLGALRGAKIAHIHFTGRTSANRKYVFYLLSKVFRLKIISHIHAPNLDDLTAIATFSFRRMIRGSDRVISLSPLWSKALAVLVDRDYVVLSNPAGRFTSTEILKEKIILFAGKLEDRKGYLDLIEAFARISNKHGYTLVLAGDGEVERARELIADRHMRDATATGWLKPTEMMDLFGRAGIFVLPSYGEGFPVSIIDAMSSNCAVITTPVGGIPDLLTDLDTCLFIQPGDIQALSTALAVLTADEVQRRAIASNGHALALRNFDKDKITGKLAKIYSDLL